MLGGGGSKVLSLHIYDLYSHLDEKEAIIEFDGDKLQLEDFVQFINNINPKFTGSNFFF